MDQVQQQSTGLPRVHAWGPLFLSLSSHFLITLMPGSLCPETWVWIPQGLLGAQRNLTQAPYQPFQFAA